MKTHALLSEMAEAEGTTLVQVAREAAEALRRQRLARTMGDEFRALAADPEALADYLADFEATHVTDGID